MSDTRTIPNPTRAGRADDPRTPALPAPIAILTLEDVLLDGARLRPGAAGFLDALERVRPRALLALCTRMQRSAALAALAAAGLDPGRFFHIDHVQDHVQAGHGEAAGTVPHDGPDDGASASPSGPPTGGPIERVVAAAPTASAGTSGVRAFFVCARPEDVDAAALAQTVLGDRATVIPVALRGPRVSDQALDRPGFSLLVDDLDQAAALVTTPVLPCSLGIVLLAYDEEASITDAIADARRFASLYFTGHEIVVVDDGSRDATAAQARACDQGDVRLVQHAQNQGMGASMRDGYATARTDLLVTLPGDRQVRPASLIRFAAHIASNHGPADPMHVVMSAYRVPHSGQARQVMSVVFRLLVRHVGGYRVDFAGAYMFHRSLLDRIDPRRTRSQSFLYSFQLLEQMRRLGCRFTQVIIAPFAREVGQSREATLGRIARMFVEIARARLESGL
jgi:Glycosyl transferase family 2